ncbi:DNA cytosine methyltransferase [Streptomyces sp. NPDC091272]|uniref:DNA cytosine methyltransferase n=1 Tax=Streptomyces sp. NPDC091272 TaxID=3365981 RepID=UPI0037F9F85E
MTAPTSHESRADQFRIVDLFAGPGGLDVAARYLGVPVEVGIEWDKDACETRLAENLPTRHGDVRDFGPADFPEANVLAGGPPCQTYTVAGSGSGRRALDDVIDLAKRMAAGEDVRARMDELEDERTGLVLEPLRWALAALAAEKPYEAIVLEQVPAVLPVWRVVQEVLEAKDYLVTEPTVLFTEEFGVPQTRRRAILIARWNGENARWGEAAELPEHTHQRYRKGVDPEKRNAHDPWVAMGDVLDRPKPFEVVSNYGTGGDPKARGRRASDLPAATVTGKISRNRVVGAGSTESRFTNAEAGQLQTFPAGYRWSGNGIPQQIGNAIPPRLGIHVLTAALGLGKKARNEAVAALEADAITNPDVNPLLRP